MQSFYSVEILGWLLKPENYKGRRRVLASWDPHPCAPLRLELALTVLSQGQKIRAIMTCLLPGFQNDPFQTPLYSLFALVTLFSYVLRKKQLIKVN